MNSFHSKLYYNLYVDLRENNIDTDIKLRHHWIHNGIKEKRIGTIKDFIQIYNFDYKYYIELYPELKIKNELDAVNHWINYGFNEKKIYNRSMIKEPSSNEKKVFYTLIHNKFNLSKLNNDSRKIGIIKIDVDDKNICKGINIDIDIIHKTLKEIKFTKIETIYLKSASFTFYADNSFDAFIDFPLHQEYYIFSEIVLFDLFVYLLSMNKKIIIIPNIDSYNSYSNNLNWIDNMKKLNQYPNFFVWSKTKQIQEWILSLGVKNNTYINFNFFNTTTKSKIKQKEYILMDTGSSLTDRKYLTEILDIFKENNLPFILVLKTVPIVYEKKNLKQYEDCIKIINKILSEDELISLYNEYNYFLYLSKYDGFGLSLSLAMNNNMFIFCGGGKPWNEILEYYPRKCFIHYEQDFNDQTKGYKESQIYYKCNFQDLKKKLMSIEKYDIIIQKTEDETIFFNWINKYIFLSNIYGFFSKNKRIYNDSSLYLCSYKERSIILLENIINILFQSNDIQIYLNSSIPFTIHHLKKMNNVSLVPFKKDIKAIGKLYSLCKSKSKNNYNFILDDDIIYPNNYIEYSCKLLDCFNSRDIYSYNGFMNSYKISFTKKHSVYLCLKKLDIIGTGTVFYKYYDSINKKNLEKKIEQIDLNKESIFADKFFSSFLSKENINTLYYNIPYFNWMKNNSKINFNIIPGLYEYKIKHNLIDKEYIQNEISDSISFKKILFYIKDISIKELMSFNKIKQLKSYLFIEFIEKVNDLSIRYPSFDYLIIDDYQNINTINSMVSIIDIHNPNEKKNILLFDFIEHI